MLDEELFVKTIDSRFWRHIHKNTDLEFGDRPSRPQFLRNLYRLITRLRYVPSMPRGYIVASKNKLVARFIPSLSREDYCVYYFCVKQLENDIAINRVRGTFGGWRLGGQLRQQEEQEIDYAPDASYDPYSWSKAWRDFQGHAYRLYNDPELKYFIIYDIANFYDSIPFDTLERKVRNAVPKKKTPIVDLLFYFLRLSNKKYPTYSQQSGGLPQDEVGDCSRILANFYLQDYDSFVASLCSKKSSRFIRFADDQIIASNSERQARSLMFLASAELAKIGLNVTAAKAQLMTRESFAQYWAFDIFKLLTEPESGVQIDRAFELYKLYKKERIYFREDTVLRRFLAVDLRRASPFTKMGVLKEVLNKPFLTEQKSYYLRRIYLFLSEKQRKRLLTHLVTYSGSVLFNQYHYRLTRFLKEEGIKLPRAHEEKITRNLERAAKIFQQPYSTLA